MPKREDIKSILVIGADGYLVTENDVGSIGNIIQFSGVTNLDPTDIVEL